MPSTIAATTGVATAAERIIAALSVFILVIWLFSFLSCERRCARSWHRFALIRLGQRPWNSPRRISLSLQTKRGKKRDKGWTCDSLNLSTSNRPVRTSRRSSTSSISSWKVSRRKLPN